MINSSINKHYLWVIDRKWERFRWRVDFMVLNQGAWQLDVRFIIISACHGLKNKCFKIMHRDKSYIYRPSLHMELFFISNICNPVDNRLGTRSWWEKNRWGPVPVPFNSYGLWPVAWALPWSCIPWSRFCRLLLIDLTTERGSRELLPSSPGGTHGDLCKMVSLNPWHLLSVFLLWYLLQYGQNVSGNASWKS